MHYFTKLLYLLLMFSFSACHKTDLSGYWHLLTNSSEVIQTWDIEGDSLVTDKYNAIYGSAQGNIELKDGKLIGSTNEHGGDFDFY